MVENSIASGSIAFPCIGCGTALPVTDVPQPSSTDKSDWNSSNSWSSGAELARQPEVLGWRGSTMSFKTLVTGGTR